MSTLFAIDGDGDSLICLMIEAPTPTGLSIRSFMIAPALLIDRPFLLLLLLLLLSLYIDYFLGMSRLFASFFTSSG